MNTEKAALLAVGIDANILSALRDPELIKYRSFHKFSGETREEQARLDAGAQDLNTAFSGYRAWLENQDVSLKEVLSNIDEAITRQSPILTPKAIAIMKGYENRIVTEVVQPGIRAAYEQYYRETRYEPHPVFKKLRDLFNSDDMRHLSEQYIEPSKGEGPVLRPSLPTVNEYIKYQVDIIIAGNQQNVGAQDLEQAYHNLEGIRRDPAIWLQLSPDNQKLYSEILDDLKSIKDQQLSQSASLPPPPEKKGAMLG